MLMTVPMHNTRRGRLFSISRAVFMLAVALVSMGAAARAESPAAYMKRVGNELLAASRSGSTAQFAMVLNANADIPSIGLKALGGYARSLPRSQRPDYYSGMINFIARYAAREAPKYPVARFVVTGQSREDVRGTYVDTRITLAAGGSYDAGAQRRRFWLRWWRGRRW